MKKRFLLPSFSGREIDGQEKMKMDVKEPKERNFFLPRHGMISCGTFPYPQIFGIINLTPDSFSDGGKYPDVASAVEEACFMLDNGAFAIDAGGESTRPGAEEISIEEEKKRLIPFIKALRQERPCCIISVDTRKSAVAFRAMEAGADSDSGFFASWFC